MKHVIFTCCDAKYGDFLVNHWYKSLKDNVDLEDIDVVILDYGLTHEQVELLKKQKVKLVKCKRDGHVNIIRFRDMADYLSQKKYDQVMATDGGDIIFQKEIRNVLTKHKKELRAVEEDLYPAFQDFFLKNYFPEEKIDVIRKTLKDKKMVNCGVLIGPSSKFKKLCRETFNLITDKSKFGPDQVAVNYVLHRDGFTVLDKGYNFLVETMENAFFIKNGEFYFKEGEKIPIVHNAGRVSFWRPIKNFGYGSNRNRLKFFTYYFIKFVYRILNYITGIIYWGKSFFRRN